MIAYLRASCFRKCCSSGSCRPYQEAAVPRLSPTAVSQGILPHCSHPRFKHDRQSGHRRREAELARASRLCIAIGARARLRESTGRPAGDEHHSEFRREAARRVRKIEGRPSQCRSFARFRLAQQNHTFGCCCAAKLLIQGGQRQSPALRQFQVRRIIHGKMMPSGQSDRGAPSVSVRL